MKLGIIRCMQTEDYCPGTADLKLVQERKGPFAGVEELELVGFVSCGGCPGKKAALRTKELVRRGARLPGQPPQLVKPTSSMGSEMFWKAPSWAASMRKSVVPGQ